MDKEDREETKEIIVKEDRVVNKVKVILQTLLNNQKLKLECKIFKIN